MNILMPYRPVANYVIIGLNTLFFILQTTHSLSDSLLVDMVLYGWENQLAFFTLTLLSGDFFHYFFNNITLWVFGNAVNSKVGNAKYVGLYLLFAWGSSAVQVASDPYVPVIGASGAICGVMAFYFCIYPRNKINVFYWILFNWGFTSIPGYVLAVFFLLSDIQGAMSGSRGIAYGAHLGGFGVGALTAVIFIKYGWVKFQMIDQQHLFHKFLGRVDSDAVSEKMILYAASLKDREFNVQTGSITEKTINGLQLSKMLESGRLKGGHLIEVEDDWIPIVEFLKAGESMDFREASQAAEDEEYFIQINNENQGPYTLDHLKQYHARGEITNEQLIYQKISGVWCKLGDII